nr:uncharacterized protein LOC123765289 [Procambarus clarkii]
MRKVDGQWCRELQVGPTGATPWNVLLTPVMRRRPGTQTFILISCCLSSTWKDVLERERDMLPTHHVKPAGCYVMVDIGHHEPLTMTGQSFESVTKMKRSNWCRLHDDVTKKLFIGQLYLVTCRRSSAVVGGGSSCQTQPDRGRAHMGREWKPLSAPVWTLPISCSQGLSRSGRPWPGLLPSLSHLLQSRTIGKTSSSPAEAQYYLAAEKCGSVAAGKTK